MSIVRLVFHPSFLCIIKRTSALHHKETEVIIIKNQNYYITEFFNLKGILFDLFDVCTKKEIAKQYQVSSSTVSCILKRVSFEKPKLPSVLCMDEFKGNAKLIVAWYHFIKQVY